MRSTEDFFDLGHICYKQSAYLSQKPKLYLHKLNQAIANFKQAVILNPSSARSHFSLGLALHNRGDFRAALDCFDTALKYVDNGVYKQNIINHIKSTEKALQKKCIRSVEESDDIELSVIPIRQPSQKETTSLASSLDDTKSTVQSSF